MDADVAVTEPRVEPITHPQDRSIGVHLRSSAAKIFLPAALAPVCGLSRGFADTNAFMRLMYWSGVGVRKSARLTVQGINTGWFEWHGRAGLCRRLTVQGINTERCKRGIWRGRRGWSGGLSAQGVAAEQFKSCFWPGSCHRLTVQGDRCGKMQTGLLARASRAGTDVSIIKALWRSDSKAGSGRARCR